MKPRVARHVTPKDRVGDLLRHPAFQGYASLLLPWDDCSYDEEMRLSEMDALLPYHSHVQPRVVVDGLNRIIDDVSAGRQVFCAFYTEEQQRRDPTRRHTGLFFFRGKPGAPFAVVAPGGGFAYVGSLHEGFPYAAAISDAGYNAFVVKYRAGLGGSAATEDLAAALSFIMRSADTLSVDQREHRLARPCALHANGGSAEPSVRSVRLGPRRPKYLVPKHGPRPRYPALGSRPLREFLLASALLAASSPTPSART